MKSTESLMECMDLNPKDMEECNFYHTQKNRLLKIQNEEDAKLKSENEEDAKLNSEKLSLRLNAFELYLYKQNGERFVGVGKYCTLEEALGHSFKLKIEGENGKVELVFQRKDKLDAILNPSKIDSSIKVEEPDRQLCPRNLLFVDQRAGDGKPTTSNKDNKVSKPTSDKNEDKKPKQSDKGTQKKDGASAIIVKTNE